jgi:hypothetical protein
MATAAKKFNGKYIKVGYEDKIVFTMKRKVNDRPKAMATWQKTRGLWTDHPVFRGMAVKEIVESLRGSDSDV